MKKKGWAMTPKEFLALALVAIVVIAAAYWRGYLPWLNINTWTAAPADMKVSARAAPAASAAQAPASKPAVVAVLAPPAAAPKPNLAATPKKDTSKKVATASLKSKKEKAKRASTAESTTAASAIAEAAPVRVAGASVDKYSSLQPFERFAKGAGEGVAYEYKSRTMEQFVTLLRDKALAKKEMRVSCDVLVRQMMEGHKTLPFEGCEGAAATIEHNADFVVTACRDEMFLRNNWLLVTNDKGSSFGVWHRKCLPNEQVLVYKGDPLISMTCLNPVVPVLASAPAAMAVASPPAQPLSIGSCPDVYTLKVNVWTHPTLFLPGVERTHAREELEERFAYVPHVSREHGAQLRRAYAAGEAARSARNHTFRVSLIMTPEAHGGAPIITKEEVLGDVTITGLYELQFKRTTLERWDAIRVVANEGDVTSPPRYRGTGLHELRFFNLLPRTTLGEWDSNLVPDCIMNEHWIE